MSSDRRTKEVYRQDPSATYITATYAMVPTDVNVVVTAGGAITLTLPPISECSGKIFTIRRPGDSTHAVTLTDKGDSIDWDNKTLDATEDAIAVYAGAQKWFIIDNEIV